MLTYLDSGLILKLLELYACFITENIKEKNIWSYLFVYSEFWV